MERLFDIFRTYSGCVQVNSAPLAVSASNRRYFRLWNDKASCIGVVGVDERENKAFISFSRSFRSAGLPVPEVYAVSDDGMVYLQEDLGDVSLFDVKDSEELLCRTMSLLPKLQFEGGAKVDYSLCYPSAEFSSRTVMFDLNYFKYCFLKPSGLVFDESRLQDEFEVFAQMLRDEDSVSTFLYRDFQARNVMVKDGCPYFIDFQGGYKGPVYYDVASFIWHARASYPDDLKRKMLDSYLDALEEYIPVERQRFESKLRYFILLRYLQVLGAYGFRGLVENKSKFVEAIPSALSVTASFMNALQDEFPYLRTLVQELSALPRFVTKSNPDKILEVEIYSFSFKKGIPQDFSGNGGGYVFDCRSIHNPGRYEQYRSLTGMDEPVIRFLEDDGEILGFMENVYGVVEPHVETFMRRGFTHLMVSFGCTGGCHRSVYCAESLYKRLSEKYPDIRVVLTHREQGITKQSLI